MSGEEGIAAMLAVNKFREGRETRKQVETGEEVETGQPWIKTRDVTFSVGWNIGAMVRWLETKTEPGQYEAEDGVIAWERATATLLPNQRGNERWAVIVETAGGRAVAVFDLYATSPSETEVWAKADVPYQAAFEKLLRKLAKKRSETRHLIEEYLGRSPDRRKRGTQATTPAVPQMPTGDEIRNAEKWLVFYDYRKKTKQFPILLDDGSRAGLDYISSKTDTPVSTLDKWRRIYTWKG